MIKEMSLKNTLLYAFLETVDNGRKQLDLDSLVKKYRGHKILWRKTLRRAEVSIVGTMQGVNKELFAEGYLLLTVLKDGKRIEGWKIADPDDSIDVIRIKQMFGQDYMNILSKIMKHNNGAKKAEKIGLLTRGERRLFPNYQK